MIKNTYVNKSVLMSNFLKFSIQGEFVINCNVRVGLMRISFCKKIIQWCVHWCNKQWFEIVGLTQAGN